MDNMSHKIAESLQTEIAGMTAVEKAKGNIREILLGEDRILNTSSLDLVPPVKDALVIDGAWAGYNDKASTHLIISAICIDTLFDKWRTEFCIARLPHVLSLDTIASGLMMMQEIMLTVEVGGQFPDRPVMIDGSRVSAVLNVHGFYRDLTGENPDMLDLWRRKTPKGSPGETLQRFESRDWISEYLHMPNVVGNLKFVTTNYFMKQFEYDDLAQFMDDRAMIDIILAPGERLREMPFSLPLNPRQEILTSSPDGYPFGVEAAQAFRETVGMGGKNNLYSIYYRPYGYHTAFKIEMSAHFAADPARVDPILSWWRDHSEPVGLEEPYYFVLVDEYAKASVALGVDMVKEGAVRVALDSGRSPVVAMSYRSN